MNAPVTLDQLLDRATRGESAAQFLLGRHYAARSQFSRAQRWFEAAARAGHGDAKTELALFALYGILKPSDLDAAVTGLLGAEQAGSAEASYHLALLALGEVALPFDAAQCVARLRRAAELGFPFALRTLGLAYASTPESDPRRTYSDRCFAHAAQAGDTISALLLGSELLRRGPPGAAETWLAMAARQGNAQAARLLSALPAGRAPTSAPQDSALDKLPDFELPLLPPTAQKLWHAAPHVATIDAVLSRLDCEYVMALGEPNLEPSYTVSPTTGKPVRNLMRTSSGMTFAQFHDDFWLRVLQRRMCALAGAKLCHSEPMALLRYLPGEEYKPHRDYLLPTVEGDQFGPGRPGQRARTIFCYLNEVAAGGATEFPILGVRVQPALGRAVLFDNLKAGGSPDPDTLHAGLPVEAGEKWLATLWIREQRYRAY